MKHDNQCPNLVASIVFNAKIQYLSVVCDEIKWIEVKKPGMEEPVGEMEEMEERGALKPVFRESGVQLLRILQQSRCPLFGHLML